MSGSVFTEEVDPAVVVEHKDGKTADPELAKYDTFNITHCLAIVQVKDDSAGDSDDIRNYEIVGMSDCLVQASNRVIEARRMKSAPAPAPVEDMETAANVWPIQGPGYGSAGWTGGWYPRVWTDPQFNYGSNYDNAPSDRNLHPYRIDNPGFPNAARLLRQYQQQF
jgi:hypothetical protein